MADASDRVSILCVDDDPLLVEMLALQIAPRYLVHTATSGGAALEVLSHASDVALVLSDLRMPEMDGVTFLREVRRMAPHATRMLMSAQLDVAAMLAAVNEAEVFKVLLKPVSLTALLAALDQGVARHRRAQAERVLFAAGLRESIGVLAEVMAHAAPSVFGRALRVRELVRHIALRLGPGDTWALEIAALLSSAGAFALPREVVVKLDGDEPLSGDEEAMVARGPALTERLLAAVPGFEVVRSILGQLHPSGSARPSRDEPQDPRLRRQAVHGGQILRLATAFDALEQRHGTQTALEAIAAQRTSYDHQAVMALLAEFEERGATDPMASVALGELRPGMVVVDEVRTVDGALLCRRGQRVTPALLARLGNLRPGATPELLRVVCAPSAVAPIRLP